MAVCCEGYLGGSSAVGSAGYSGDNSRDGLGGSSAVGSVGYSGDNSAVCLGDGSAGYSEVHLMKGAMAERMYRTGQGAGCLWREV